MTEATLGAVLSIAGGISEVIGLGLIVREVVENRRQAREVLVGTEVAALPVENPPHVRQGPLSRFFGVNLDDIAQVTNKQMRETLLEATNRLIEAEVQRDMAIRDFLSDQLTASIRLRITGIIFFFAGLVCGTAAQLMQAMGR